MKVRRAVQRRKVKDGEESVESGFSFIELFDGIASDEQVLKIFEGIARSSESLLPSVTGTMVAVSEESKAGKSRRRL